MTAQQRNGTTNSSPRSAVRRSRPSFCGSRRPGRTFGARSEERGPRSAVGGAGTDAGPDNTSLPGREKASPLFRRPPFSGDRTESCGRKVRRNARGRAGRRRPGSVRHGEGRADANTAQGPEKKESSPAALQTPPPRATGRRRPTGRTRGRDRRRRAPGRSGGPGAREKG